MENGNNIFTATIIEKIEFFKNVFHILQVIDSRMYSTNSYFMFETEFSNKIT